MVKDSRQEIDEVFSLYQEQLWTAMTDENIRVALSRAVEAFRKNKDEAFKLYPNVVEIAEELKSVKENSLLKIEELSKQVKERIEDLNGRCFVAKKPEDAMEYIKKIVGKGDIVVKSKSMTCEELQLNHLLEEYGCDIYETDLGEFIIQHLNSKPMHILSPAIHVPKEKVAEHV